MRRSWWIASGALSGRVKTMTLEANRMLRTGFVRPGVGDMPLASPSTGCFRQSPPIIGW
jgi:hypothetical protein